MSDLAYADFIVILSSSYSNIHSLSEAVTGRTAAVGKCINASLMSALIEVSCAKPPGLIVSSSRK